LDDLFREPQAVELADDIPVHEVECDVCGLPFESEVVCDAEQVIHDVGSVEPALLTAELLVVQYSLLGRLSADDILVLLYVNKLAFLLIQIIQIKRL